MASSSKPSVPDLFHPKRSFKFPKRKFGATGGDRLELNGVIPTPGYTTTQRAIRRFAIFAVSEGKLLASTKRDPAFISSGFTYWKEATTAFTPVQATEKPTKH